MYLAFICGLIFLLVYWPVGVALIIIGLIIMAVRGSKKEKGIPQSNEKKCPKCAELVKAEALVCRFCHYEFPKEEAVPVVEPEFKPCPKCEAMNKTGNGICRLCGHKLTVANELS